MIRWWQCLVLRTKAMMLEAQIDHANALIIDHKNRLENCYRELRRVRAAEAMVTPANTLLEQALRRKNG